jgi:hypothetical protein
MSSVDYEKLRTKFRDWKDELLTLLLDCGYRDLERLFEISLIATKFGISTRDILEEVEGEKTLNNVIYTAMTMTLKSVAKHLRARGHYWYADMLEEWEVYVNACDSYFNIEPLDIGIEEIESKNAEQIVEEVKQYLVEQDELEEEESEEDEDFEDDGEEEAEEQMGGWRHE